MFGRGQWPRLGRIFKNPIGFLFIAQTVSLLFWMVLYTGVTTSVADDSVVQRFFSEAPRAWEQIYSNYNGTEFEVDFVGENFKPPISKAIVLQLDGDSRVDFPDHNQVHLFNFDYQATVSKRHDGEWYISGCESRAIVGSGLFAIAHPSLRATSFHIPKCVFKLGTFLQNNQSALILKDAWKGTDSEGHEIITVDFVQGFRNENQEFVVNEEVARGFVFRVDFSPRRSWCVVRVEHISPSIDLSQKSVAIFSSEGPHPSEIQNFKGTANEKEPKMAYREVFSELRRKSLDANQFRVSSFGLTEPTEFIRSRPYRWISLCLLFAGFVGLYVILRTFRNKPSK
jgi:hypothetical protein